MSVRVGSLALVWMLACGGCTPLVSYTNDLVDYRSGRTWFTRLPAGIGGTFGFVIGVPVDVLAAPAAWVVYRAQPKETRDVLSVFLFPSFVLWKVGTLVGSPFDVVEWAAWRSWNKRPMTAEEREAIEREWDERQYSETRRRDLPATRRQRIGSMTEPRLVLRRLVEQVLGKGRELPLTMLLEQLVPVAELRRLAQKFGMSPKGFRVERAPARVLANQLAELKDSQQLDEVLALLKPAPASAERKAGSAGDGAKADVEALLRLRESDLARVRDELERAREAARRSAQREADLARDLLRLEQEVVRQRRDRASAAKATSRPANDRSVHIRTLERRVRELEDEREGFLAADVALRRQLAHNQSHLREVEAQNAELEVLIPKSRRRKKKPLPPPEPEKERRVIVPRFLPSFYKSLVGKERKAVERAVHAVLLFCTEGHSYPGLEVKQLGGQDTWSLRASLGLRVYFRPLSDGDIEVLELGDREDQNTTLRRLKEK